jgi:hypothetical protein
VRDADRNDGGGNKGRQDKDNARDKFSDRDGPVLGTEFAVGRGVKA